MAFSLFRKREAPENENREQVIGEGGTISDILLSAIMSGSKVTKQLRLFYKNSF